MRWRSGVVLKLDSSRALVRADEEDNTISIKAQGPRASALLTTIRTDFAKLHPNLAVQEFLIVRELIETQPTGREVPVDYTYLCELETDNTLEAKLPRLKGKYNIPNLLNGVESRTDRQSTLNDRQALSRRTRTDRPLQILNDRPKRHGLITISALMLVILAVVAAIFAAIAHFIPGLNFIITCTAILLAFAAIAIVVLRATGIIDNSTFQKTLDSFLNAVSLLQGKDSGKADNNDRKSPPESDHETPD